MRLDIHSAVAFQQNGRRSFGTAHWIEGETIGFTTHGLLDVGDKVEMRLELAGAYDSVWAEIRVTNTHRPHIGGPLVCIGELGYMPGAERARLDDWVEEQTNSVRRRWQRRIRAEEPAVSISSDQTSVQESPATGRELLRAALRASLRRLRRRDASNDAFVLVPDDPAAEAALELSRDGTTLLARWADRHAVARDWQHQLSSQRLLVVWPNVHPPPRGWFLTLRAALPTDETLPMLAEVRAVDGQRVELAVQVTAASRRRIRRVVEGA